MKSALAVVVASWSMMVVFSSNDDDEVGIRGVFVFVFSCFCSFEWQFFCSCFIIIFI